MKSLTFFSAVEFEERDSNVIVKGVFKNSTDKPLTNVWATGQFEKGESDILLFPGLNVMTVKTIDVIMPFQEIEFCHYLKGPRAIEEAKTCDFEGFTITYLGCDEGTLYEKVAEKPARKPKLYSVYQNYAPIFWTIVALTLGIAIIVFLVSEFVEGRIWVFW